jgi:hypothetical protein
MSCPPHDAKSFCVTRRKVATYLTTFVTFALVLFIQSPRAARAQTTSGSTGLVISQVYTRGGEAGAAFQNDYIEIFNRGSVPVDMNSWGLHIAISGGPIPTTWLIRFASSRGIMVEPGRYVLIKLAGGPNGQPLPSADFDFDFSFLPIPLNLSSTSGTIALLLPDASFQGCPTLQTPGVVDYIGYGAGSTCFEGVDGPAPAPTLLSATLRGGGGCTDNNSSALDFALGAANPRNSSTAAAPCNINVPLSFINFAAPQFHTTEDAGHQEILVTRTGDVTAPATVDYIITGGTAFERSDYTTTAGRLRFAPGETQKSFDILLTDDATQEPNETVEMLLWKPTGAGVSTGFVDKATLVIHDNDFGPATSNPADSSAFYVRQHYHDFLNREPDEAGLQFWTNNIESCGTNAQCREVKRIDTSAAFFLSIEFQRTGFLVHRLYRASLPDIPGRTRSLPRYAEFVRDTQEIGRGVIVNTPGWELKLQENTAAYLEDFVKRPDFTTAYPAHLAPAQYVDKLNAQAGSVLSQTERDALVLGLTVGLETRATVLRKVAENGEFSRRELNRAFVLMQYFGYLRRAPNDPPDTDFTGYDFWLAKLEQFGGDYRRAEMVKAFITSPEYRARFAAPLP